jgi:hypothetical protein
MPLSRQQDFMEGIGCLPIPSFHCLILFWHPSLPVLPDSPPSLIFNPE